MAGRGRSASRHAGHDYAETGSKTLESVARIRTAQEGRAVLNNHPRAGAVANAAQLKAMTGQDAATAYPDSMIAAYPDLAQIPSRSGGDLFKSVNVRRS